MCVWGNVVVFCMYYFVWQDRYMHSNEYSNPISISQQNPIEFKLNKIQMGLIPMGISWDITVKVASWKKMINLTTITLTLCAKSY